MLAWVAISYTRGLSPIQGGNLRLLLGRRILYHRAVWEAQLHILMYLFFFKCFFHLGCYIILSRVLSALQ